MKSTPCQHKGKKYHHCECQKYFLADFFNSYLHLCTSRKMMFIVYSRALHFNYLRKLPHSCLNFSGMWYMQKTGITHPRTQKINNASISRK